MKKALKVFFTTAFVLLLAVSAGALWYFRQWLFVNPFQSIYLENVLYAARDAEGNTLVLDKAGSRLLKIRDGELLWKAESSPDTFSGGKRVVADGAGTIYVQSATVVGGIHYQNESIVKYAPDGEYAGRVAMLNSANRVRPKIAAMTPSDDGLYWIQRQEDKVLIYDEENHKRAELPLPDADKMVLHFAYDPITETLWYSTYDGRILRYEPDGESVLLYDSAAVGTGKESIPREISYSSGVLYATDYGLRDVIAIRTDTGEISRLASEKPLREREIAYYLNADYGLILASNNLVINWDDSGFSSYYEVELTKEAKHLCIALWTALIILSASAAVFTGIAFARYFLQSNRYTRIGILIVAGVMGLGFFIMGSLMPVMRELYANALFSREKLASDIVNDLLPIQSFYALDSPSDFYQEDYLAVKAAVETVFLAGSEDTQDLYCTLYKVIDGVTTQVYAMDDSCVVYPFDWDLYSESTEQDILVTGEGQNYMETTNEGSFIFSMMPLLDGETPVGIIEVGTNMDEFERQTQRIFLSLLANVFAIAVLAFFMVTEFLHFAQGKEEYQRQVDAGSLAGPPPIQLLRFTVFMVFFFTNLTTAILPLHVMRISADYPHTFGLRPETLAAIPISAEVAAGALFSIFGGKVIQLLKTKRAVKVCAALFTIGLGLRVAPDIWVLTAGSLAVGTGWGVLLLLVNVQISNMPEEEKDTGFAHTSAAAFTGINSGIVLGGFLMQWVSYTVLFILAAVSSVALYLVVSRYLSSAPDYREEGQKGGVLATLRFLFAPRVLLFIFMIVFPVVMCGYFLNYLFPILGDKYGLSETYIGYAYLINGFCAMMFGPVLTGLFTRARKKRLGLLIAAILYSIAFFLVAHLQNIPSLLAALALLGLSDGFGLSLQTGYFTDLEEVRKFGYDNALGVYSLFENAAQSVGPLVFSYALLIGIGRGLMAIAVALTGLALLYAMFSGKSPEAVPAEETGGA